jgi:hypothetical protein
MSDPRPTRGVLRTVVDVLAEFAMVFAVLGMTVVTWVPDAEPRAMAQIAAVCTAIALGYAVVFMTSVSGRRKQRATGFDAWAPSIQDLMRAGAGLVLGALAWGRSAGWW